MRSEVVDGVQDARFAEAQLDDAVAVVLARQIHIERSVPARGIEEVARIGGDAGARLPESAEAAVRSRVPNTLLLKGLGVVSEHPSVVGTDVAVRSPLDVHHAILNNQPGTLRLTQRVEGDDLPAVGIALELSLNCDRTAEFFSARGDVDGMQAMKEVAAFFGFRHQIHGVRGKINRGRPRDPDFRNEVATTDVAAGNRSDASARIDETHLPQRSRVGSRIAVCIKRVQAVVLGRHIDNVVRPLARDAHTGNIERLSIDVSVHGLTEELAEFLLVDVGRHQHALWPNFRSPLLWDVFAVSTYFTVSFVFWPVR